MPARCEPCSRGLLPDYPKDTGYPKDTKHRHRLPTDLANELLDAKLRLGATYRLLGWATGRDHSYLVRLFHGERAPSVHTVQALVSVLPLSPETASELLDVAIVPREYPTEPQCQRWDE